jgi:copper homeostasis protein
MHRPQTPLEVPVFGPSSAHDAVAAGASRLELNALGSYAAGGLTPSLHELSQLQDLDVAVRVMVRPRGAPPPPGRDFVYSADELEAMERTVRECRASGLMREDRGDGFVFGVLREVDGDGGIGVDVDVERCARLVEAAAPFRTVFHRAFDDVLGRDPLAAGWTGALEAVVAAGFDGILTSGGLGGAAQHLDVLERIVIEARGRVEIIVGGGVRSGNITEVARLLALSSGDKAAWAHSSCLLDPATEKVDKEEVASIAQKLYTIKKI